MDKNRGNISKAKESIGKSGSFFFSTYDKKFILKTLYPKEAINLKKMLYEYFIHLMFVNKDSLLSRYYGIF